MSRKIVPRLYLVLGGLGMAGIAGPLGCASNHVDPVDARLFTAPPPPDAGGIAKLNKPEMNRPDPALAVTASEVQPTDILPGPTTLESPKSATVLPDPLTPIPAPFNTIKPLEELGSTPSPSITPTTQPASQVETAAVQSAVGLQTSPQATAQPPAVEIQGQGVYQILGGVIAKVNDVPIYANQVLDPLKKEFSAKARTMDPEEFRYFAREEIYLQLKERIDDEKDFASAYQSLSEDDKKLADVHAMIDRHDKVIAAGGSVEVAKQRAADQGLDFDEVLRKDYREVVFYLFEHRHIEPLIQVSADNMREFYQQNLDKLYREKEQAQFRVIQVDPAHCLDIASARQKINALRERAAKGEDFTQLASTENDDALLKDLHGNPCGSGQWMDRNSYAVDAVEAAVWQIQPGQITPVVESNGKFYIAKLEAKRGGITHQFEDQTVQADIYARLRQQQLSHLWQLSKDESAVESTISADTKRIEVAVEIAMQRYAQMQSAPTQSAQVQSTQAPPVQIPPGQMPPATAANDNR
jgi:parvulin-like peptidyl-prolyl isomerase